jgi:glucan phosphorylase
VLQYTTLDGWTDEVNWDDKGFVLPDHDPVQFFGIIKDRIVPEFYRRDENNVPREWAKKMLNTIQAVIDDYSAERQVNDYIKKLYLPLLKG